MQCPSCPVFMTRLAVGTIELDECPRCLGMWFDKGELQEVLSAQLANRGLQQRFVPAGEAKLSSRAACPRCVVASLQERDEHGHPVAGCQSCGGMWITAPVLSTLLKDDVPVPVAKVAPAVVAASVAESIAHEVESSAPAMPAVEPLPLDATVASYGCPACGGAFREVEHEGQPFFECLGCHAVHFSRGGLPYFLGHHPERWPEPPPGAPPPRSDAPCPACGAGMDVINWSGVGTRVLACGNCWGTFVSAQNLRRFVNPRGFEEQPIDSSSLFIWRVFDRVTDWLSQPR